MYLRAFGVRSLEEKTPVTPDTLFRLGSTTKMMTALVALEDAAAGRLDLDAPVRTYVKDLHSAIGKVTLRQLLTHTAGMAEGPPSVQSLDDAGLGEMVLGWKADAAVRAAGGRLLVHGSRATGWPGTSWSGCTGSPTPTSCGSGCSSRWG